MLERPSALVPYEVEEQTLDLSRYVDILKKRILYIIIPFCLVFALGFGIAMWWPPTYLSEARMLVETQQIPPDLVRPTVISAGRERIMVIEQRVMTRDNLLAIADKYRLYADRREQLSRTELLDLMRENTSVKPIELGSQTRRNENVTIAMTVGFMDRRPDIAARVANELVTLFLNEDARNRTNRAMETTRFLAREVQRLEGNVASVDAKIADIRRQEAAALEQQGRTAGSAEPGALPQLTAMRAELAQKSGLYSPRHPEVKRLKAQIKELEKLPVPPPPVQTSTRTSAAGGTQSGLVADAIEALQTQRTAIQKNLETAAQKLAAARLGESLERDQFSERLEVVEQAVVPQTPIKPNRPKFIAFAFAAALMAGAAGVFGIELFDRSIRTSSDLLNVADGRLIVPIPYISTKAELSRRRKKVALVLLFILVVLIGAVAGVHWFIRPLDELWLILMQRLMVSWPPL